MARNISSISKMSRREGYALHPKAHKTLLKRPTPPGQHGGNTRGGAPKQYGQQLREKQKVKRIYGLLEKQFANLMAEASRKEGQSGTTLLQYLERRMDNAVYRAGFAPSRRAARQLVTHGHFMLNGRRVDIPSIRLSVGDEIVLRESSKKNEYFNKLDDVSPASQEANGWLKIDRKKVQFSVVGLPTRDDAEPEIKEQLIVEYYSR